MFNGRQAADNLLNRIRKVSFFSSLYEQSSFLRNYDP